MSDKIDMTDTVTLAEAARLIVACPDVRYMLEGEPGVGKSAVLPAINKLLGNTHHTAYIDVPNMDLGDTAMPALAHDTQTTAYYLNERFGLHTDKPVIIMLDEFGKGALPVQRMLHPLLEIGAPRIGSRFLKRDDNQHNYVFGTSNLTGDGVGDNFKSHTCNRLVFIRVAKPTPDEWMLWGVANNIHPAVLSFVKEYPQVMASYTDHAQADNPYIFNPRKLQRAFVTPRSLERASNILYGCERSGGLNDTVRRAALTGAIGAPAARDLDAFIEFYTKLPKWNDIIADPANTPVPECPGTCHALMFKALMQITEKTVAPWMVFLRRMSTEWQTVFVSLATRSVERSPLFYSDKSFQKWLVDNQHLIMS